MSNCRHARLSRKFLQIFLSFGPQSTVFAILSHAWSTLPCFLSDLAKRQSHFGEMRSVCTFHMRARKARWSNNPQTGLSEMLKYQLFVSRYIKYQCNCVSMIKVKIMHSETWNSSRICPFVHFVIRSNGSICTWWLFFMHWTVVPLECWRILSLERERREELN